MRQVEGQEGMSGRGVRGEGRAGGTRTLRPRIQVQNGGEGVWWQQPGLTTWDLPWMRLAGQPPRSAHPLPPQGCPPSLPLLGRWGCQAHSHPRSNRNPFPHRSLTWALKSRRLGYVGTLEPMASGLMVVLLGQVWGGGDSQRCGCCAMQAALHAPFERVSSRC